MIREALYKITENCPCNCTFCDAREKYNNFLKKSQITFEDWKRISDNLIENGLEVAIISGGEALLEENTTYELIKYLQSKNVYVVLNTSGVLFNNENKLNRLLDNYPDLLVFSIDSSIPSQHDDNRKINGLYNKIIKSIEYIKNNGNYSVAIRTVITKQNFRQLPDIIKNFNQMGIDCIKFTHIENDLEGTFTLSIDELNEFDSVVRNEMLNVIDECSFNTEILKQDAIKKINNLLSNSNIPYSELAKSNFAPNLVGNTKCDIVERFITIQSNGDLIPCCEAEHHYEPILGNLLNNKLEKIFATAKYKDFAENRPDYCKRCTEWQNMQISFNESGKKVNKR